MCGEKGGNNHDATKKWSFVCIGECFAALNFCFFLLIIVVIVCGVCVRVNPV